MKGVIENFGYRPAKGGRLGGIIYRHVSSFLQPKRVKAGRLKQI
jgi:hypothetical protein